MTLLRCWEIRKCGREKGGTNEASLGPCPAYPDRGHSCWMVTGTFCGGKIQGTFAQSELNCLQCEVYQLYNPRSGRDKSLLVTQCELELAQYLNGRFDSLRGCTPEKLLEAITESVNTTLEEQIQARIHELMEANERLGKEIEVRKNNERQIRHLAYHDPLTDLPNRIMLEERLTEEISRTQREQQNLAVLFINLDRFKTINDTLGHSMGDKLLKAVGKRLKRQLRKFDIVSRPGGDEFVVVLSGVKKPQHVAPLAGRLLDRLKIPFHIELRRLYITASMGIAVYPGDGEDSLTLLKNADCAMHRAKELGRNGHQFCEPEMGKRAAEQGRLETALPEALERGQFFLEYQPQLDLRTNTVVGMEALVRWHHPELGIILPGKFIPLAEETGLIIPIGEWVLRTACAQNKAWQNAGYAPLCVAVNLSARQFRQQILAELVAGILKETRLNPERLELEITESAVLNDATNTIAQLKTLSERGVKVSLDDFGTGYSSLNYLKTLPVNSVKIDRTFVKDLPTNADDVAIARAIIVMAHRLKLSVVAEGVETNEQLALLRRLRCDIVQGFLISRPLLAQQAGELLPTQFTDHAITSRLGTLG